MSEEFETYYTDRPEVTVTGRPSFLNSMLVALPVMLLYAFACYLPAIQTFGPVGWGGGPNRVQVHTGLYCLLLGWLPHPKIFVPWSANIFLLVGLIAFSRGGKKTAKICGIFGVCCGLGTFNLLLNNDTNELLLGYYFWEASLIYFLVGTIFVSRTASH
ncbi:hypothetical protein KIH39_02060 [Telmatocola sphagniphila]|uniref:Transmembrane protein n=1 Tax=Telmatocola sphagniphila TaxID=1123043 RepID=A0A8E6B6D4_9BACT|nr:hypothetical protein [Telmatocola sphagniphila]QVL32727.1 hypothetical protein KIH39_02060 [Telmatocola sphagniphila]